MKYRTLGRTGWNVSEIGFGATTRDTSFPESDHRSFHRNGEAFDRGETFSGVDFDKGLSAVEELRALVPPGATLAQLALEWSLMFPEITTTIPGAKSQSQISDSAAAAELSDLPKEIMAHIGRIYDHDIRELVHDHW